MDAIFQTSSEISIMSILIFCLSGARSSDGVELICSIRKAPRHPGYFTKISSPRAEKVLKNILTRKIHNE